MTQLIRLQAKLIKPLLGSGWLSEVSPDIDMAIVVGGFMVGQADATVLRQTSTIPSRVVPKVVNLISRASIGQVDDVNKRVLSPSAMWEFKLRKLEELKVHLSGEFEVYLWQMEWSLQLCSRSILWALINSIANCKVREKYLPQLLVLQREKPTCLNAKHLFQAGLTLNLKPYLALTNPCLIPWTCCVPCLLAEHISERGNRGNSETLLVLNEFTLFSTIA